MWKTILFDLDGTVTDPKEGITKAVATALAHFGIQENPDDLTKFIGPPLDESFPEFYGFDAGQTRVAVEKVPGILLPPGLDRECPLPRHGGTAPGTSGPPGSSS